MTTTNTAEQRIVLPDTSLCAIVRDELMNPAKGIVDFVDSTLPYVEAGVIVDTGSKDGTREALEELKKKYSHLEVYDAEFQGFAHARNESLKHCKTKRALVLDADERFTRDDFKKLAISLNERGDSYKMYSFNFLIVNFNGTTEEVKAEHCLNPRLFNTELGLRFEGIVWEHLSKDRKKVNFLSNNNLTLEVEIKHFDLPERAKERKFDLFYKKLRIKKIINSMFPEFLARILAPEIFLSIMDLGIYDECKQYNSAREKYR